MTRDRIHALCLLLTLASVAACTHGAVGNDRSQPEQAASTDGLLDKIPDVPLAPGEYLFDFESRYEVGDRDDPRIVGWRGHECGATTAVARVTAMPVDDPHLAPPSVVEFAADGRRLRAWVLPFETPIVGLSGDRLRFVDVTANGQRLLWTDPSGTIGDLGSFGGDGDDELQIRFPATECPASLRTEGMPLETWQCYRVEDDQGADRRIAFPIPCN